MSAPETTIPASLWADLLRVGDGPWVGPVEYFDTWAGTRPGAWTSSAYGPGGMAHGARPERIRLPLTRPECRAQLARVLAVGLRCEPCKGTGKNGTLAAPDSPRDAPCFSCSGTGYLRRPAPAWHLLERAAGGTLPDDAAHLSPVFLARHARLVAAGRPGLVGFLGTWTRTDEGNWRRDEGHAATVGAWAADSTPTGFPEPDTGWVVWHRNRSPFDMGWHAARGPEVGDAGKAAADAVVLGLAHALLGPLALPEVSHGP